MRVRFSAATRKPASNMLFGAAKVDVKLVPPCEPHELAVAAKRCAMPSDYAVS